MSSAGAAQHVKGGSTLYNIQQDVQDQQDDSQDFICISCVREELEKTVVKLVILLLTPLPPELLLQPYYIPVQVLEAGQLLPIMHHADNTKQHGGSLNALYSLTPFCQ
ncbi:hypothetical protein CBL_05524 [Carabus blaptoides fortunei]